MQFIENIFLIQCLKKKLLPLKKLIWDRWAKWWVFVTHKQNLAIIYKSLFSSQSPLLFSLNISTLMVQWVQLANLLTHYGNFQKDICKRQFAEKCSGRTICQKVISANTRKSWSGTNRAILTVRIRNRYEIEKGLRAV